MHPLLSFLTRGNATTAPSAMSRLSYIYDMNSVDQIPNQVFKTQLKVSLSHKNEVGSDRDASLVIEALNKRGQSMFKGKKTTLSDAKEEEPKEDKDIR